MADDIIVRIRAEGTGDFIKALNKAGIKVEKTGKKVEKESDRMSKSFKKIGQTIGAAFATAQLIQFGKALTKLAVELDATEAKYKKVFGSASNVVSKFAKENATALGLTVSEYKRAAAAAGDLLIPIGFQRREAAKLSSGLVNLSGALSAWSGGQIKATEVSNILTKALLGEREQLKTLGIQISEADVSARLLEKGQKKLTGTMLAQAKATATLELIYEKSTDAQDAFKDSTKTLAEQQLVLQANFKQIGEDIATTLVPILNRAFGGINDIITKVKELNLAGRSALEKGIEEVAVLGIEELEVEIDSLSSKLEEMRKTQTLGSQQDRITAINEQRELIDIAEKTLELRKAGRKEEEIQRILLEAKLKEEQDAAAAAAKAAEDAKEAARLAALGQEGSLNRINDLIKTQMKLLDSLAPGAEWVEAKDKLDLYIKSLEDANKEIIKLITTAMTAGSEITPIVEGVLLGDGGIDGIDTLATGAFDKIKAAEKDSEKTRDELRDERLAKAADGINAISSIQQTAFDAINKGYSIQLQNLETKNEKGLISEKEYDKEKSKILTKQAKADKANSIFRTITGTAAAIVQALNSPPPASFIFAALAGAIGAVQLSTIAAQPIPKFAKGTKGSSTAPAGFAWVGEEGPELMQMKGGEKIVTNGDSEEIMRILAGYSIPVQFKRTEDELYKPMRTIKDLQRGSKGIDWNPLLDSNYKGMKYHGRKLDRLHQDLVMLNNNLGRKMTAN